MQILNGFKGLCDGDYNLVKSDVLTAFLADYNGLTYNGEQSFAMFDNGVYKLQQNKSIQSLEIYIPNRDRFNDEMNLDDAEKDADFVIRRHFGDIIEKGYSDSGKGIWINENGEMFEEEHRIIVLEVTKQLGLGFITRLATDLKDVLEQEAMCITYNGTMIIE